MLFRSPICHGVNGTSVNVCSSHGQCAYPNQCECSPGWTGLKCDIPVCYGVNGTNSNACSSHGQCMNPNQCQCSPGWTGLKCDIPVCYGLNGTNSNVCSGHGVCVGPDTCQCTPYWELNQCQQQSCYGQVLSEPLLTALNSVTNSSCVGKYDNDPIQLLASLSNSNFSVSLFEWRDERGVLVRSTLGFSGTGSTLLTPQLRPTCDTSYTALAKLEHRCFGRRSLNATVFVKVAERPQLSISPSGCVTRRSGFDSTVRLTATLPKKSSFVTSFKWVSSSGETYTTQTIDVAPTSTTTYTAVLTYQKDCFNRGTISVSTVVRVVDVSCGKKKVTVCKVPPGNPRNAHEICVSENAVSAQLSTGSYVGPCSLSYTDCPRSSERDC